MMAVATQDTRRAVKTLLLTMPGVLEKGGKATAKAVRDRLGFSTEGSITSIRHDFVDTMRHLDELHALADWVANRLPPARSRGERHWFRRYNQLLFQHPDWTDAQLGAALKAENFSGFDMAGSHGASSESIKILREHGALLSEFEIELREIYQRKGIKETVRKQLIDARLGQGKFRAEVLARWENACAVTGSTVRDAIRASHAKPWKFSTDEERLCAENGLPLLGTLDALFDKGLITFDDTGHIRLSPELTVREEDELNQLGLSYTQRLCRQPTSKEQFFLAYHRNCVFRSAAVSATCAPMRNS
jgi:hypothetical protein